ncbi:DUF6498-containing protein [Halorubrum californiense]|uniref:DUF6498-containing protein n=1 Tax=Halorubrum californiense TaxID=416585 RepID=UPI000A8FB307|nr:DUF6498-containing protein [Halorubrum californiense]
MNTTAPSDNTRDSRIPDPELAALIIANLVPIVGIVAFDLSVLGLLTLYWLEFGVVCFWAVVRALFAGRPVERDKDPLVLGALDEKGASIPIPVVDADIQVMSIPTLLFVTPFLVGLWIFVGALVVGPAATVNPAAELSAWIVAGAFGIFLAEGWRTITTYFRDDGYQDHNVATALQSVLTEGATVLIASVVALLAAAVFVTNGGSGAGTRTIERVATGPLVIVVVSIRLLTDLAGYYYDGRLGAGLWSLVGRGDEYTPPNAETIETTLSGTPTVLRPSLLGRLIPTTSHFREHPGPWLLSPLAFLAASVAVSDGSIRIAVGFVVLGIGVPLTLVTLDYWVRYAGIEYQADSSAIVATDTLFRTPLWRYDSLDDSEVQVERDAVDGWLDTSTVIVDRGDRPTKLPRLADPTAITRLLAEASEADNNTRDWNAESDNQDSMIDVGTALLRLDSSSSTRMSLVSMGLFGAVSLIALIISAQFEGSVAAGVFVFLFTTIPLALLIIYAIKK